MIIGFLIGFLAVAAAVSAISAVLIGLGARIFTKQPIPYAKRFWISFGAVVTALVLQWIIQNIAPAGGASFLAPVPAIAFFAVSWLLITRFLNTAPESKSGNVVKGLLVTVFQSVSMLLIGLVVALAIVGLTRR
jgi:hypothetical protein